jgi:hypothetical protein
MVCRFRLTIRAASVVPTTVGWYGSPAFTLATDNRSVEAPTTSLTTCGRAWAVLASRLTSAMASSVSSSSPGSGSSLPASFATAVGLSNRPGSGGSRNIRSNSLEDPAGRGTKRPITSDPPRRKTAGQGSIRNSRRFATGEPLPFFDFRGIARVTVWVA